MRALLVALALGITLSATGVSAAKKPKKKPAPPATTPAAAPAPVGEPEPAPAPAPVATPAPVAPAPVPAPTPGPTPATTPSPGAHDKVTVAVMAMKSSAGLPPELVDSLTNTVPQALDELRAFKSLSANDILQMLALEQLKQQMGCDQASCLAEIGGAIGADYLITSSVIRMDDVFLLQFQLINIKGARVEQRVSREYKGGPQGLLEETRTATKLLVRDILAQRSGKLLVQVSVEGASVKVDGAIFGVSPLGPFDAAGGMHTVAVEKEGFVVFSRDVEIVAKQTTQVDVTLVPSDEYKRDYEERSGRLRTLAYAGMGAGVVGLGAGIAAYLVSHGRAATLRDDVRAYNQPEHARTSAEHSKIENRRRGVARLDATALLCGGVGLGALGAGFLLYVNGDDPHRFDSMKLDVVVEPRAASLTVRF